MSGTSKLYTIIYPSTLTDNSVQSGRLRQAADWCLQYTAGVVTPTERRTAPLAQKGCVRGRGRILNGQNVCTCALRVLILHPIAALTSEIDSAAPVSYKTR